MEAARRRHGRNLARARRASGTQRLVAAATSIALTAALMRRGALAGSSACTACMAGTYSNVTGAGRAVYKLCTRSSGCCYGVVPEGQAGEWLETKKLLTARMSKLWGFALTNTVSDQEWQ